MPVYVASHAPHSLNYMIGIRRNASAKRLGQMQ